MMIAHHNALRLQRCLYRAYIECRLEDTLLVGALGKQAATVTVQTILRNGAVCFFTGFTDVPPQK